MALLLGLVAGPVLAANPHVVKGPTVSQDDNSLAVTVVRIESVTYDVTLSGEGLSIPISNT